MKDSTERDYVSNLKGLDILRFILSIAVVVYHYQHFFYPLIANANLDQVITEQPFFYPLKYIYTYGYHAVPVFWLISGIVFFKVYKEPIYKKRISFGKYMINRLSRLYPLHLITLLLVAGLQYLMFEEYQKYFVYPVNTTQTFFQNLLFIQSWGDNMFSFNGPSWSVSIEVFVYIFFFLVCVSSFLRHRWTFLLILISFTIIKKWELVFINDDMRFSLLLFFIGGAFITLFDIIKDKWLLQVASLLGLAFLWLFSLNTPEILAPMYRKMEGRLDLDIVFFSLTIVLAFIMFFNIPFFERCNRNYFRLLGNMTYSTYLIHFPIQIVMFMILKPQEYTFFFNGTILIVYLVIVLVMGRLVFVLIEVPLKRTVRERFAAKRTAPAAKVNKV